MTVSYIFYFFSSVLLLSAIAVISMRNPVHSALFLVLAFFSMAAIWLLLLAEFLAIVLVLVYVGAVMVLFLFVVMMLDINVSVLREGFAGYLLVGAGITLFLVAVMALSLYQVLPETSGLGAIDVAESNTQALGKLLFTEYLYEFEIAGVILLTGIVAAIALTFVVGKRNKSIDPARQVSVSGVNRMRLVNIPSEGTSSATEGEEEAENGDTREEDREESNPHKDDGVIDNAEDRQ